MPRITLDLSDEQSKFLNDYSMKSGCAKSDLIRIAIEDFKEDKVSSETEEKIALILEHIVRK